MMFIWGVIHLSVISNGVPTFHCKCCESFSDESSDKASRAYFFDDAGSMLLSDRNSRESTLILKETGDLSAIKFAFSCSGTCGAEDKVAQHANVSVASSPFFDVLYHIRFYSMQIPTLNCSTSMKIQAFTSSASRIPWGVVVGRDPYAYTLVELCSIPFSLANFYGVAWNRQWMFFYLYVSACFAISLMVLRGKNLKFFRSLFVVSSSQFLASALMKVHNIVHSSSVDRILDITLSFLVTVLCFECISAYLCFVFYRKSVRASTTVGVVGLVVSFAALCSGSGFYIAPFLLFAASMLSLIACIEIKVTDAT